MKNYTANELRELFLKFFESKDHLRLESFSLVPKDDPSLLLINSGMAPMKPYFTGDKTPPSKRICTCQKSVRTGDIENIGKTDRHFTFFEMLGNFSFGDYFKRESIAWGWEFLTSPEWLDIDPERLYPSVYVEDDEAFNIWVEEIGISPDRITRMGKADNFWEHGTGACGPCSEIYFDRGKKHGCQNTDCKVGCECDRFIEVWNIVFSQFNSDGEGNYTELKQKNIDTGMGLERLACVCQDADSVFEIDSLKKIISGIESLSGEKYKTDKQKDVSIRVIADHLRSAVYLISDGVLPSNEGRGYVLRRLIRRACRHGKTLGLNDAFLFELAGIVIELGREAYPELEANEELIYKAIKTEEENFGKTLDQGLDILSKILDKMREENKRVLSGEDAFRLYSTFGFPLDITEDILIEQGLSLDREGFNLIMEDERETARRERGEISGWSDKSFKFEYDATEFLGYDMLSLESKAEGLFKDNKNADTLKEGEKGVIILKKTPFYAEMGGQSADFGTISSETGSFSVEDVKKSPDGVFVHIGRVSSGEIREGQFFKAEVNKERRDAISRAHSATHLLHAALREVLGDHVHQAGSLVEADELRFDFTHFSAMSTEEIKKVTDKVNEQILKAVDVSCNEMKLDEARKMGAQALFGEKYEEDVRVISISDFSSELCGGIHVRNTSNIGPFKIISEGSVSSGIRRVEAICGNVFFKEYDEEQRILASLSQMFKVGHKDLVARVKQNIEELKSAKTMLTGLKNKMDSQEGRGLLESASKIGDIKLIAAFRPELDKEGLQNMGDALKSASEDVVAVLASEINDKLTFLAVCGKNAIAKGIKAGDIIKQVTAITGGRGGGKPDFAMGSGEDKLMLDNAFAMVDNFIAMKLGILKQE